MALYSVWDWDRNAWQVYQTSKPPMALYSVWDWDRNAWQVYQTSKPVSVGDDPVSHQPKEKTLGADPDTGVKPLPRGAKFVRYDHVARGEVRRKPHSITDVGDDAGASGNRGGGSTWWILAGGVGLGWVLSSWLRRKSREVRVQ